MTYGSGDEGEGTWRPREQATKGMQYVTKGSGTKGSSAEGNAVM